MVIVTFSHQGALDTKVSDELAEAVAAAADARANAAVKRITVLLLRARRSDSTSCRHLLAPTRDCALVSVAVKKPRVAKGR
jgi:hypothetical protein